MFSLITKSKWIVKVGDGNVNNISLQTLYLFSVQTLMHAK
ncbi:hypothetical protein NC651_009759 [Populus alba x Populus x berolinensis]|nr:hypothetical protein NC651_009759 [Populus alba x Populus x berolinensis]